MDGTLLRQERTKRNLSQAKLARFLRIHQAVLSQWETGKTYPPAETLKDAFDILES